MTDTITIRPTPVKDLKPGDRIRRNGQTLTVRAVNHEQPDEVRVSTAWGHLSYRVGNIIDVVVGTPTDPEPEEPTWPTAPLIRITKTSYDWDNIPASGLLALRTGGGNYLDADDVDYFQKDAAIVEWEDLTPIRADLIKELREACQHTLTGYDPAAARVMDLARGILYDADRSQP